MFEAAKRYVRSIEGSVWCTERFTLIEAMSTAIENSEARFCTHPEARIFEPGTLRLELLMKPGIWDVRRKIGWLSMEQLRASMS